ncbi:sensor histidine kinase [Schlesneria paludicola]|uniref:sensor histidine kinase n=1 Tax=Schlesneria paludicola TaxID=360056 RepID=UPI00138ABCF4|nr:HAMP domain-containing sensor histidine kinase [Schlesneria paludicola]
MSHSTDPVETDSSDGFILPDAEKLESLAEFAAGAGHEINNPLATIIGRAQLLLKDETNPERRQMLMTIGAQAYRIRDMIGDTMLFGRPPRPDVRELDLQTTVENVVSKQVDELKVDRCSVKVEIRESIRLRADPAQFSVVLSELIRNSRQALQPDGGEILISSFVQAGSAIIEIHDHGRGFTDRERRHAFDPFFSGRQAGRGLGFGLPKCWRIIQQHGGTIKIRSTPSGPTIAHVTWPTA